MLLDSKHSKSYILKTQLRMYNLSLDVFGGALLSLAVSVVNETIT